MPPRALVIDDEPDIRELLAITLGRMQLEVDTAADYASGVRQLGGRRYDLVLTDMRLPDGDGLDLVAWIQDHRPGVPVAVITAHGNVEAAVRALKLGAFDFISKPLDLAALRKLITATLKLGESIEATGRRATLRLLGDSIADAAAAAADCPGGPLAGAGACLGRLGYRQGTGGAADPRVRAPCRRAVRAGQLRRDPDRADGERAVRPQEGQLHRRRGRQGRPDPQRRRRHAVPRRGGRPAAAHAGEAAARDPGEGRAARRRDARGAGGRAHPVGHAPQARGAGEDRPLSRRPLLPHQRDRAARAGVARAAGRRAADGGHAARSGVAPDRRADGRRSATRRWRSC